MAISIFIASADYRSHVRRKIRAYHVFIQAGHRPRFAAVWLLRQSSFGTRSGRGLETFVRASRRQNLSLPALCLGMLPDFLLGCAKNGSLAKFIADRQDTGNMRILVPDAPPIDLERRNRDGRARAKAILRSEGAVLRDFVDSRMPIYDVDPDDLVLQGYDPATGG